MEPSADVARATPDTTRERILAAAEEIFLEKGFDKATVRDICNQAEANVAAVNYHFRDKRSLYEHVLFSWSEHIISRYPLDMGVESGMGAEQRLGAFIRAELLRLLPYFDKDPRLGLRRARLVLHELTADPPNTELLLRLHAPVKEYLDGLLADILGPGATRQDLDQCANCIIGQCVHYLLSKLGGLDEQVLLESEEDLDALTRQITIFSLGGLRAVAETIE